MGEAGGRISDTMPELRPARGTQRSNFDQLRSSFVRAPCLGWLGWAGSIPASLAVVVHRWLDTGQWTLDGGQGT